VILCKGGTAVCRTAADRRRRSRLCQQGSGPGPTSQRVGNGGAELSGPWRSKSCARPIASEPGRAGPSDRDSADIPTDPESKIIPIVWHHLSRRQRARPPSPVPVEKAKVALARAQLDAQSSAADNIDLKAMGLLGFNGALVVADLAAKDLIHRLWWAPLPGLAVSIALCLAVSARYAFEQGPDPAAFYTSVGGQPPAVALAQLLADLRSAYTTNLVPLERKWRLLTAALFTLFAAAVAAGVAWLIK
jgi:hypothetical protein